MPDEQRLIDLLERIDSAAAGQAPARAAEFSAEMSQLRSLAAALASGTDAGQGHFALREIRDLLQQRRRQGAEWDMPDHLASCPLCLETFATLLSEPQPASAGAMERYLSLWPGAGARAGAGAGGRRRLWRWPAACAAAAVLLAAAGLWLVRSTGPVPATIDSGTLVIDGSSLPVGPSHLPRGQDIRAAERAAVVLADGTRLDVETGARLAVWRGIAGGITVNLHEGQLQANVAPQGAGRRFVVQTPLGRVSVVGTRFGVRCGKERVQVYEKAEADSPVRSYDAEILSVTVAVTEGVVLVHNGYEEARLGPDQQAVLREHQPHIEVIGSSK